MNEHNNYLERVAVDIEAQTQQFFVKVYGWMSFALLLTALTAMYVLSSEALLTTIFSSKLVFYGFMGAELLLVIGLTSMIRKLSAGMATSLFVVYAILNGVTLSSIFLVYTASSITSTFFITAGTFAVMSLYGYSTKSDLTKWGNILFMALIGLIIASVVNMFLHSNMMQLIISCAGVLIFVGLIAYDTQKLKSYVSIANEGEEEARKVSILGALTLYLDFINLFLYLLRLLGRRK